jgi:multidrug efflux pump
MKRYFTDIFIQRPVLAMVVSLLILILGIRSMGLLNVRQYPKIESAKVTVTTAYFGANAELVKGFITAPLEKSIAQADGIDYIESSSSEGSSTITAHLQLNYDPNDALTQVTARVNAVKNQLPPQSQQPRITVGKERGQALLYMAFYSDQLDSNQVTDYLRRVVVPKLSAVQGVRQAKVLGGRQFAMRIWLDPTRMAAHGVTGAEVRSVLQSNNYLSAVGQTKGSMIKVNLIASTDIHTAQEFRNLVVKNDGDSLVRLKDIANVTLGAQDYSTSVKFEGHASTGLGVEVVPTANPLTVISRVRDVFPQIKANLPPGLHADLVYDATEYISDSITEVMTTIAEALVIVIIVIFLFLGSVRSVVIPVIAMPLSLVGAFFIMYMLSFSINLLTLLAMVLAIGLVVDDAIIVVENIHRHIEDGVEPFKAALRGARELGTSVIAMSITLIAVYAPIGFLTGLTGTLFTEFAFTVAGAVLVSGIVALTLSPMMCSKFLKAGAGKEGFTHWLDQRFDRLKDRYERMLHGALNFLPVTIVFAVAVLISVFLLFSTTKHELAPTEDQGFIFVSAQTKPTATLDYTALWRSQVADIFSSIPEKQHSFSFGGGNHFVGLFSLKSWSHRERSQAQVKAELQKKLSSVAGIKAFAGAPPPLPGSGGGTPVQIVVTSTKPLQQMLPVVKRLRRTAQQSGLFVFTQQDLKFDKPLVEINIDRDKVAALGLTMADVGADLSSMLGGGYINYFALQGRSYRVIAQVKRQARLTPAMLKQYYISTAKGKLVPLSTIATLKKSVVPESLSRFQQMNAATISAVPAPGVTLGQALKYMQNKAADILPAGYSLGYTGQSRQYERESGALVTTFFFAIIIIYLVLAALFESFRDPFIVLISVPMSVSGALIFLSLGFATVNIYTEVGLITLIGLISKHGILIVQFANQLQRGGMDKRQAIEESAGIRLRPILMTTAAMIAGVVPLLIASGPGAVSRFDIGLVIAAGMAIGTLFTLFVVPSMYLLLAKKVEPEEPDSELQPDTMPPPE